jgi:hypothetical protein
VIFLTSLIKGEKNMTKTDEFKFIDKVIDRLEQRQQILLSLASASEEQLCETVCELVPTNPVCNTMGDTYFLCAKDISFKCTYTTTIPSYDCPVVPNNLFYCKGTYMPDCEDKSKQYVCNNNYVNPCMATPSKVYECGSFTCGGPLNYPDPSKDFNCKNGYGCNALKFDCIAQNFSCADSKNFNCMGQNNCNKNFGCGSDNAKFDCIGETKADRFTCKVKFECAKDKVQCVPGRYSCKKSVSCNPNGQPFTPPSPPEP